MDFEKVEQKLESFIVVVVGAVKTVENWHCSFHGAEKRRLIFQIHPGNLLWKTGITCVFHTSPGKLTVNN